MLPTAEMARLGFAYASSSGLDALLPALETKQRWKSIKKTWILGLHHGITEPLAIKRIQSQPNSSVRLFVAGSRLTSDSLLSQTIFHAKSILLEGSGDDIGSRFLIAGSGNLTGSALANPARNFEIGVAAPGDLLKGFSLEGFNRWWDHAWKLSVPASDANVEKYTKFRASFFAKNPDTLSNLDRPSSSGIADARVLWIEAGQMSGGSRNQIEFSEELAGFLGPVSNKSKLIKIRVGDETWTNRPLTPKTTSFGVSIWRLGLPTTHMCGLTYPGSFVRLERSRDSNGEYFQLTVAIPDSTELDAWRSEANRTGFLGRTQGQHRREFGVHP